MTTSHDVNDDWIIVDAPNMSEAYKPTGRLKMWIRRVKDYYKKAVMVYQVYRVIKLCINIYILYNTLMPYIV